MVRALPSAIQPKMYRHFALVTVLLTLGIAMFADGENREAAAAQTEQREAPRPDDAEVVKPPPRRSAEQHRRSHKNLGFDGFDRSFGAPMDNPLVSLTTYTTDMASIASQTGYSDKYLASLGTEERAVLLAELEKEGLDSPQKRERKTAALIAASEARSGRPAANP